MERTNPSDTTAPKKFYACALPSKELSTRDLAKEISFSTAISSVEVMAVLEAFTELLPKHLTDGRLLRLGDFGSMRLNLRSQGEDTAEDVKNHSILGTKLLFRPSKELSRRLAEVQFRKVSS